MRVAVGVIALLAVGCAPSNPGPRFRGQMADAAPLYLTIMGEPVRSQTGSGPPFSIWLSRADLDSSGSIDAQELVNDAKRFFATLDVDGSNQIERAEMDRYEREIAPARVRLAGGLGQGGTKRASGRPAGRDGGGPPGGGRPRGGGGPPGGGGGPPGGRGASAVGAPAGAGAGLLAVPQPVAMADADLNGRVTADEFEQAALKRFGARDLNKDRVLTQDELVPRSRRRR